MARNMASDIHLQDDESILKYGTLPAIAVATLVAIFAFACSLPMDKIEARNFTTHAQEGG